MNRKLAIRTAIGLAAIVLMFLGYTWFSSYSLDPEFAKTHDTAGYIAALERNDSGTQAVLFNPAGDRVASNGYESGNIDQEVVWSQDGNHLFLSSNRGGGAFKVFRWNPTGNTVEDRSLAEQSQTALAFGPGTPDEEKSGLVVAGGKVYQYFPKLKQTVLLLSTVFDFRSENREGAATNANQFGTAFRQAIYAKDRQAVYTIMLQEDGREALVIFYLTPDENGQPRPPYPIMLAEKLQLAVNKNGDALVAVRTAKIHSPDWPTPPPAEEVMEAFVDKNALLFVTFDPASQVPMWLPIAVVPSAEQLYWDISLSPEGDEFAAIAGDLKDGQDFHPKMLVLSPMRPSTSAPPAITPILEGPFSRPQWSADGRKLVMLADEADGKRTVITMNKDGSGVTKISKPGVDYEFAAFSPQIRAGGS